MSALQLSKLLPVVVEERGYAVIGKVNLKKKTMTATIALSHYSGEGWLFCWVYDAAMFHFVLVIPLAFNLVLV